MDYVLCYSIKCKDMEVELICWVGVGFCFVFWLSCVSLTMGFLFDFSLALFWEEWWYVLND